MTAKYTPVPTSDAVPSTRLTAGQLLDIVTRSASLIEELGIPEVNDEHKKLLAQLHGIAALATAIIDGSHMGCAADEAILLEGNTGRDYHDA